MGVARTLRRAATMLPLIAALIVLAAAPHAAELPVKNGHGVLWRISDGKSAPSYLFGTIHVTDKRVHDLPAPVKKAFDSARSLSTEIEFDAATAYEFGRAVRLPRGKKLEDVVGFRLYEKVADAVWRRGIPTGAINRFKPWVILFLLDYSPQETESRSDARLTLDHALYARAKSRKLPTYALETFKEHLRVFEGLSTDDQIALLRAAVGESTKRTRAFKSLIDLYLARDLATAYREMMVDDPRIDPRLSESFRNGLLFERNAQMVKRAIPRIRDGAAFIAVGALHLPGDKGMVNLLAKRGFRVERVY